MEVAAHARRRKTASGGLRSFTSPARTPERFVQLIMRSSPRLAESDKAKSNLHRLFRTAYAPIAVEYQQTSLPDWEKTRRAEPKLVYEILAWIT